MTRHSLTNDAASHFKSLESQGQRVLDPSKIHVLRLDGRAFSTYTRGLQRPYDAFFATAMNEAAIAGAKDVSAQMGYVASDEISLVFAAATERSQLPYGGKVDKLLSLTASMVSVTFNQAMYAYQDQLATFDARVISLDDAASVKAYLEWRQADTYRNAVMMAARSVCSHNELNNLSGREARALTELRYGRTLDEAFPTSFLRGRRVQRVATPEEVTFTHSRTGATHTICANRSRWVAEAAPAYRSTLVDDLNVFAAHAGAA